MRPAICQGAVELQSPHKPDNSTVKVREAALWSIEFGKVLWDCMTMNIKDGI